MMDKLIEKTPNPATAKALAVPYPRLRETFPNLFLHLNDDQLAVMASLLQPIQVPASVQALIEHQQWTDALYLVCSGVLSVCIDGGRREIELGLIERGQWVGDIAVIEPGPASATVMVLENATLLILTHDQLQWLRERHPSMASYFLQSLSQTMANRLRTTASNVLGLDNKVLQDRDTPFAKEPARNWSVALHRWMLGINRDKAHEYRQDDLSERRRELESVYHHRYQHEKELMLNKERERILAELHDGVGGQLVAMLSMLENNSVDAHQLKDVVRAALDDLRLMIDSLDSVEGDIPVVLGMLRSRLEPRLMARKLSFDWQITDLPAVPRLGSHEILQLLRIMQEAITNIIKHARASVITLSTEHYVPPKGSSCIRIVVQDDGIGLGKNETVRGHGLSNMRQRAHALGGSLLLSNAEKGVRLQLDIPVGGDSK